MADRYLGRLTVKEIIDRADRGERIPDPRGRCAVCLASVRLRQDGTIGHHMLAGLRSCGGTGYPPTALDDA